MLAEMQHHTEQLRMAWGTELHAFIITATIRCMHAHRETATLGMERLRSPNWPT